MGAPGWTMHGVECPECGDLKTGVFKAGFDQEGHRIRARLCRNCEHRFTTLEMAIPFVFNQMDTQRVEIDRKRNAPHLKGAFDAAPRLELGRFVITHQAGDTRMVNPIEQYTIRVVPAKRTNRCRRGLHALAGRNVRIDRQGRRHCRECNNAYNRRYRAERKARFPELVQEDNRKKAERNRIYRARRREREAAEQQQAA